MIITNTQEYMIFIDFRLLLFIQLGIKKRKTQGTWISSDRALQSFIMRVQLSVIALLGGHDGPTV